ADGIGGAAGGWYGGGGWWGGGAAAGAGAGAGAGWVRVCCGGGGAAGAGAAGTGSAAGLPLQSRKPSQFSQNCRPGGLLVPQFSHTNPAIEPPRATRGRATCRPCAAGYRP